MQRGDLEERQRIVTATALVDRDAGEDGQSLKSAMVTYTRDSDTQGPNGPRVHLEPFVIM